MIKEVFGEILHRLLNQLQTFCAGSAPSRRTRSLAQAIYGWTRPPRPQSVPAMTFLVDDFREGENAIGPSDLPPRFRICSMNPSCVLTRGCDYVSI